MTDIHSASFFFKGGNIMGTLLMILFAIIGIAVLAIILLVVGAAIVYLFPIAIAIFLIWAGFKLLHLV